MRIFLLFCVFQNAVNKFTSLSGLDEKKKKLNSQLVAKHKISLNFQNLFALVFFLRLILGNSSFI